MTTDEIAAQLAPLIRWEPGMLDMGGVRVVAVASGFTRGVEDSGASVYWSAKRSTKQPNLTDKSTMDVLWGQLRRRFEACGWTEWRDGFGTTIECPWVAVGRVPADERTCRDYDCWGAPGEPTAAAILLAGYRRVVELEKEQGLLKVAANCGDAKARTMLEVATTETALERLSKRPEWVWREGMWVQLPGSSCCVTWQAALVLNDDPPFHRPIAEHPANVGFLLEMLPAPTLERLRDEDGDWYWDAAPSQGTPPMMAPAPCEALAMAILEVLGD